ncbi:MAG: hypothetical protein JWM57_2376 [Phycisphaerales bacterium]|nr:hypothetical protein [Phycisphaerales bacterium]
MRLQWRPMIEGVEPRFYFATFLRPDLSYGDAGVATVDTNGYSDNARLVDSHGRIIAVLTSGDIEFGPFTTHITRASAAGDRDKTFGPHGWTDLPGNGFAAALQADDKLIIAKGSVTYRLTVNGRLDPGFGDGGRVVTPFTGDNETTQQTPAVRVLANGKIRLAIGRVDLYQLNADGSPDTSFGVDGHRAISLTAFGNDRKTIGDDAIYFDASGRPYLFLQKSETTQVFLARLSDDGTPDLSFGSSGQVALGDALRTVGRPNVEVYSPTIAFTPDGGVVVTIQRSGSGGHMRRRLIRLNSDGSPDAGFGDGGGIDFVSARYDQDAFTATVDSTGGVYVATRAVTYGGPTLVSTVRLRPDGVFDRHFGRQAAFIDNVTADGRLYADATRHVFRDPVGIDRANRLHLDGTAGADQMTVDGRRVTINGERFAFDVPSMASIVVDLGGGDDRLESNAAVPTFVSTAYGSSGAAFVRTDAANDEIRLGNDDTVYAGGGSDSVIVGNRSLVYGGDGADSIDTSGRATVYGEAGNDEIRAYGSDAGGRALIYGGDGNDRIYAYNGAGAWVVAGRGDDVVSSSYLARVTLTGGPGIDLLRSVNRDDAFPDRTREDIVRFVETKI